MEGPLRIGLIAAPMLPVPPTGYAGTERIVGELAAELHRRGHDVTVFASGDSKLPCRVVPVTKKALWLRGYRGDVNAYIALSVARAWEAADQFDVIHSHVETGGFLFARHSATPVISTLHGRLDSSGYPELIDAFRDIPLVAISDSQRRWSPRANWVATIHHGLDFTDAPWNDEPGSYLLAVGRAAPEKGVREAIEVARAVRLPLVMAMKVHDPAEQDLFSAVIKPAIREGVVDWRGEVGTPERDELMAGALATLMLGCWPEPFGLVAIESMAVGTPVIGRRAGALTETVQHGLTGFLVDDLHEAELAVSIVGTLNRQAIRTYARSRFAVSSMVDRYETAYRSVIASRSKAARTDRAAVIPMNRSTGVELQAAELRAAEVQGGQPHEAVS
jgi:glycosyltransferase involved in cell wall biosynthesis